MKLVVLCPYPRDRAPSQRLKYEQYFGSWEEAGFHVEVRPFWDEAAWNILYREGGLARKGAAFLRGLSRRPGDLNAALEADLVYLHLEAVPLGPPVLERRIHRAGVPMVYDMDDLIHLPHSSPANPFMRFLRAPGKAPELMAMARHTIVCTEYLADFARPHAKGVTNISSTIDTDVYRPRPHRDRTEGVVLGWSGSHSTAPYLNLLADVLRELQATDGVRIKVIGDASAFLPGVDVQAQAWRRNSEVADLSELDIGLYPLPEEEWVRGKSGLKALQYMALEIPTVAQNIGTNPEIIRHGVNGFLASEEEEWLTLLRRLIRDPDLRRTVGGEGRRTVEARYSVRANAPVYLDILHSALES